MNIVYLTYRIVDPMMGGVEKNTATQANYFEQTMGHTTWYLATRPSNPNNRPDAKRQFYLPALGEIVSTIPENVEFFKNFLKEHNIDVVINQMGMDPEVSRLAYHARSVGAKLLSVPRCSINGHIKHARYTRYGMLKKYHVGFLAPLLSLGVSQKIVRMIHKRKFKGHLQEVCANSDWFIVLSEQHKAEIADYLGQCPSNVIAINNPYPFAGVGTVDLSAKEKEILFVGRFDSTYKRPDFAVRIWAKLFREFPDWTFRMLGDGPEFNNTVTLAKKLKVERVIFEGFKKSEEFYPKASLLMMTSTSEGFPMTLVESQGAGCVPLAFQSFSSVVDIIDDGKNGVLVKPFDCDLYAKKLASLMKDDARRREMAINAVEKSKEFVTEKIYGKWLAVFDSLFSQAKN